MTNLTRDQGILQAIAALCRDLDNNKMPSYLCNDWSSEAPMRSCECHAGSPMATREPCQGVLSVSPSRASPCGRSGQHLQFCLGERRSSAPQ